MRRAEARETILDAFAAALAAIEPRRAVSNAVKRTDPVGSTVDGTVAVVAIGKAAAPMTWGASDALGDRLVSGIAVGASDSATPHGVTWHTGTHPLPDDASSRAGQAVVDFLDGDPADHILFLISGGGSSLLEIPPPGMTIDELADIHRTLMDRAVPIEALNLVRRSMSQIKNGRLLAHVNRPHSTLVISDVGGSGPEVVASGPTIETQVNSDSVRRILKRAEIPITAAIAAHLDRRSVAEHPVGTHETIVDGWAAVRAAVTSIGATGVATSVSRRPFSGEARRVGPAMVRNAEVGFTVSPGEATVAVTGAGTGGRNTEAALAVAIAIAGDPTVLFGALTTDGIDGSTDAAGAIVDGGSVQRMTDEGLEPDGLLADNDSFPALEAASDLVRTGPTSTNVADLWFVWRESRLS